MPQLEKLQQAVLEAGVPAAEFLPVVCDLTKEAEVAALPRIVQKRWPGSGIDLVVNNAGAIGAPLSGALFAWKVSCACRAAVQGWLACRQGLIAGSEVQSWGTWGAAEQAASGAPSIFLAVTWQLP